MLTKYKITRAAPRIILPYTLGNNIKAGSNALTVGSNKILIATNASQKIARELVFQFERFSKERVPRIITIIVLLRGNSP